MFPLGMKHKLHGTTPIEQGFPAPLDALTRQTDFRQLGNVFTGVLFVRCFQPRHLSL